MLTSKKDILNYLNFLEAVGFTVTLHGEIIVNSNLLEFNFHQNPYCKYIKTGYGKWNECICRQHKIYKKLEEGEFFGCCHSGVGEFVYPITVSGERVGFISVSGYLCEETKEKIYLFSKKHNIPALELERLSKRFLNPDIPQKSFVDSAIKPLEFMLENYFLSSKETTKQNISLLFKMQKYIAENSHLKITMGDLSRKFNYSVSTLSHLFMKNTGKSLPEYIDELRINEAKWYLTSSDMSVSQISEFLGYSSNSYFSTVFKKLCGTAPNQYRKEHKLK